MNFKDQLYKDLSTFLNTDEFAEEVNINGKMMKIVIDNDTLEEYKLKNGGEGLDQIELLFHAEKSNFERKPSTNNIMHFDEKKYRIADVSEDEGMYTFKLTRNQS